MNPDRIQRTDRNRRLSSTRRGSGHPGLLAMLSIAAFILLAAAAAVVWHTPEPATADDVPEQFEPAPCGGPTAECNATVPNASEAVPNGAPANAGEHAPGQFDDDVSADAEETQKIIDSAAERGDWQEVARVLAKVTAEFDVPYLIWHYRALACLKLGDAESYREICESLLGDVALLPQNLEAINSAAWTCTVAPRGTDDPDRPIVLAEMLAKSLPDRPLSRHAFLNTIGAVYLRAGRWREAITALHQGIEASGGEGVEQDWLLLALAQQALGDWEQARHWLEKQPPALSLDRSREIWNRAEVEVLRAEATREILGW